MLLPKQYVKKCTNILKPLQESNINEKSELSTQRVNRSKTGITLKKKNRENIKKFFLLLLSLLILFFFELTAPKSKPIQSSARESKKTVKDEKAAGKKRKTSELKHKSIKRAKISMLLIYSHII